MSSSGVLEAIIARATNFLIADLCEDLGITLSPEGAVKVLSLVSDYLGGGAKNIPASYTRLLREVRSIVEDDQ